ncbi:MAG: hypothetical protein R6U50_05975 [Desulfobacterales bacterium]
MIKLNIIMNTNMEEVLAFKCCSLPDQNLEVQIKNTAPHPITIQNFFVLRNDDRMLKVEHVYPPRNQKIDPNDMGAFYCSMDENVWQNYNVLEVMDTEGNTYRESYSFS